MEDNIVVGCSVRFRKGKIPYADISLWKDLIFIVTEVGADFISTAETGARFKERFKRASGTVINEESGRRTHYV